MDGLPQLSIVDTAPWSTQGAQRTTQRTLKSAICCVGTGLHSGRRIEVTLRPAAAGTGIVFHRTDLGAEVAATFDRVADTRLCTVLASADNPDVRVGTVEHLMAALSALGIDNIVVELNGPEVPVLDGSAAPWVFLLDCAGIVSLDAAPRVIEVLRPVRVEDGHAFAELRPSQGRSLELAMSIDFAAPAIGRQALVVSLTEGLFREGLAPARTFTQAHEVAGLRAAGLAQGGSLDNAVVVDGAQVLNPAGLRMSDEFVRHKALDAVGDMALAGAVLRCRFVGHRSGHALNNQVLRALFTDPANWRDASADTLQTVLRAA